MRKIRRFSIMGVLLAALTLWLAPSGVIQPAKAAGDALDSHFQVIASQVRGDGTYDVTFDITVTNSGSFDYADLVVTLIAAGPDILLDPTTRIPFGLLLVGETATVTRTLRLLAQVEDPAGFRLEGFGQESNETNDPVSLQIYALGGSQ